MNSEEYINEQQNLANEIINIINTGTNINTEIEIADVPIKKFKKVYIVDAEKARINRKKYYNSHKEKVLAHQKELNATKPHMCDLCNFYKGSSSHVARHKKTCAIKIMKYAELAEKSKTKMA